MEGNRHHILPSTFDGSIGNRKVSCTEDTLCHTWLHIYQNKQLVKQNNKIKKNHVLVPANQQIFAGLIADGMKLIGCTFVAA